MSVRTRHNIKIFFAIIIISIAYYVPISQILRFSNKLDVPIVASFIGSSVALITGILALLKDFILDAINKPLIKIQFFPNDKRDCHATAFTNQLNGVVIAKTHYFRFRVMNIGYKTADGVEVSLEEVRKYKNRKYELDKDFMPLRLFWSHWRERRFELDIPSGTYRHCDFGFVLEPRKSVLGVPSSIADAHQFWFDVFIRPNTGKTSLSPGRYEITIGAFGKNANKATLKIEMEWIGGWQDNIEDLYSNNLKILKVK